MSTKAKRMILTAGTAGVAATGALYGAQLKGDHQAQQKAANARQLRQQQGQEEHVQLVSGEGMQTQSQAQSQAQTQHEQQHERQLQPAQSQTRTRTQTQAMYEQQHERQLQLQHQQQALSTHDPLLEQRVAALESRRATLIGQKLGLEKKLQALAERRAAHSEKDARRQEARELMEGSKRET